MLAQLYAISCVYEGNNAHHAGTHIHWQCIRVHAGYICPCTTGTGFLVLQYTAGIYRVLLGSPVHKRSRIAMFSSTELYVVQSIVYTEESKQNTD